MLCSGIIGGNLANLTNTGLWGLLLFCVLMGIVIGMAIGLLYNKLRVPCIVLTIGLMLFFEALPRLFFSSGVRTTGNMVMLSMAPNCYWVGAIMLVVFYVLYEGTAFGHNIRALGASPVISANVGLDADRMKFKAFTLAGLFFGVAGALYVAGQGRSAQRFHHGLHADDDGWSHGYVPGDVHLKFLQIAYRRGSKRVYHENDVQWLRGTGDGCYGTRFGQWRLPAHLAYHFRQFRPVRAHQGGQEIPGSCPAKQDVGNIPMNATGGRRSNVLRYSPAILHLKEVS